MSINNNNVLFIMHKKLKINSFNNLKIMPNHK